MVAVDLRCRDRCKRMMHHFYRCQQVRAVIFIWLAYKTLRYLILLQQSYTLEADTAGGFPARNRQRFHLHTHEGSGAAGEDCGVGEVWTRDTAK